MTSQPATGYTALRAMSVGLTGMAVVMTLWPRHEPAPEAAAVPSIESVPEVAPAIAHEPPPPPSGARFSFVFRAGGTTYVKLADVDGSALPAHGVARLAKQDYDDDAIAELDASAVPADQRAWLGRDVVLDTGCRARVVAFALVARANGDASWVDENAKEWTPSLLFEHAGAVLAARLDGCTEGATYARDASLPPAEQPVAVDSAELVARARRMFFASAAAKSAQHAWTHDWQRTGSVFADPELALRADVLEHPRTHERFVSITAHRDHGCGDPDTNVWGLFRVKPDGSLAVVTLRTLTELDTVDTLLDIDNDGSLEAVGRRWLGENHVLEHPSGDELDRDSVPFFGCPC
ncbi:MAG TPA: hypothetical protein VMJ10_08825 [Kofleriaceae bacterium]|nr:hypothetical protein [Kofleriaceae bacterium]